MKRMILDKLKLWKEHYSNQAFMLIGARQVGKTYVLKEFCQANYKEYIYINLEYDEDIVSVFDETMKPLEIIDAIGLIKNISINPEETAIIFDEIQVSERAITSLKYFSESDVDFHILCAGSLLGVALNRFKSSFPVGKVYRQYLHPMNFQEFLWAIHEEKLDGVIQKAYKNSQSLMEAIHNKCLKLYRDYLFVGGMPASILEYINKKQSLNQYDELVKRNILDDYLADMSKYTTTTEHQKIEEVYRSLPKQLGRESRFNYKLVDEHGSKRKFESSIDWLINSQIAYKCILIETPKAPLSVYEKDSMFKLYVNDVGLLMSLAGMKAVDLITDDARLYRGMLTENYIAQTFISNHVPLHYWKSKHNAELDFLINYNGNILPVEVKAANNTKSKSLKVYRETYAPTSALKVSANNFNESNGIKSIPLYAAYMIREEQ